MERDKMELVRKTDFSNPELEDAVIGSCLISTDAIGEVMGCGITEQHFTKPESRMVFSAMASMAGEDGKVDLLTVANRLRQLPGGMPEGMLQYLTSTTTRIVTTAHLSYHCELLHGYYVRRQVQEFSLGLLKAVGERQQEEMMARIKSLTDEADGKRYGDNMLRLSAFIDSTEAELEKRVVQAARGEMSGVPTGLTELDALTHGWQPSSLNIIAGRPAMGKTAICLHFALSAARKRKHVCIYSLEMSRVKLADRMLLAVSDGLDSDHYRSGLMTEDDTARFHAAKERLRALPVYIDDRAVCTTAYIRANARRMRSAGCCDMVIIDYLQLTDMSTGVGKQFNREQQVSKASREFKVLAKELDVPVLLLSQLSRAVEGRGSKKPQLSDLRESGSIEQDADIVAFLYRPEYYGEEGYAHYDGYGHFMYGVGQVIVAKHRDGALGEVPFCYNRSLTKIWDGDG